MGFGKLFISNPDLPARLRRGAPLNPWTMETFYTPGPDGLRRLSGAGRGPRLDRQLRVALEHALFELGRSPAFHSGARWTTR